MTTQKLIKKMLDQAQDSYIEELTAQKLIKELCDADKSPQSRDAIYLETMEALARFKA